MVFLRRPLLLVVAFTIIGSFFIPFLAATLLHLNNRVRGASPVPKNKAAANIILVIVLVLFLALGAVEIGRLF